MPPHLAMTLKVVIRLVTVSVSYLILRQEFYLIKIYHVKYIGKLPHTSSRYLSDENIHVRTKFNALRKLDF